MGGSHGFSDDLLQYLMSYQEMPQRGQATEKGWKFTAGCLSPATAAYACFIETSLLGVEPYAF